jgi:phosphoglycerate dehydrogenase-like enzyme
MEISLLIPRNIRDMCFSPETLEAISQRVDLRSELPEGKLTPDWTRKQIAGCKAAITGWGTPKLDGSILDAAPGLEALFHSAGSIKSLEFPGFWDRGVRVSSAANANGIPVAEFLLGQILVAFKGGFGYPARFRANGRVAWRNHPEVIGYYGTTVGIIGMGNVGKHLLKLLDAFQFRKLVHSFYPFEEQARRAGVEMADIDTIMAESDAVVVAAPNIPEYRHMFDGRRLGLMKDGAWFLNAARGALVDEAALIAELQSGRISACLDVTEPEPPVEGSPFYTLPNVVLTPHVAGSTARECLRLGEQVLREIDHWLNHEPFDNEITAELAPVIG